jgi:Rab-GTPase-TBC domain
MARDTPDADSNGRRTPFSIKINLQDTVDDPYDKPHVPVLREAISTQDLSESLPPPPALTVADFWANVVRNYKLVQRTMPAFLFHKIRDGGIPSVLRRIVWTAMAGITPSYAQEMQTVYVRLEGGGGGTWKRDIGRDITRTWPGVQMFKEQDGEGQKALRGVLQAYSVWDHDVGYCQGYACTR